MINRAKIPLVINSMIVMPIAIQNKIKPIMRFMERLLLVLFNIIL